MNMTKRILTMCLVCLLSASLCIGLVACAPTCEHVYGDWTVTIEPTCETDGARTRACTKCAETETDTIAALGHTKDHILCDTCGESLVVSGAEGFFPIHEGEYLTLSIEAFEIPSGDAVTALQDSTLTLYIDEDGMLCGHGTLPFSVYSEAELIQKGAYNVYISDDLVLLVYRTMDIETDAILKTDTIILDATALLGILESDPFMFDPEIKEVYELLMEKSEELEAWYYETLLPIFGETELEPVFDFSSDMPLEVVPPTSEDVNASVISLLNSFFLVTENDSGYTLSFDLSKFTEINEAASELTLIDLVEGIFGESFFAEFEALIPSILALDVETAVSFFETELGCTVTDLVHAVDELLFILYEVEEATLNNLLGMDIESMLEDEEFLSISVLDLLKQSMIEEGQTPPTDAEILLNITSTINELKTVKLYDLLYDGDGELLKDELNALLSTIEQSIDIEITLAADGTCTGSSFTLITADATISLSLQADGGSFTLQTPDADPIVVNITMTGTALDEDDAVFNDAFDKWLDAPSVVNEESFIESGWTLDVDENEMFIAFEEEIYWSDSFEGMDYYGYTRTEITDAQRSPFVLLYTETEDGTVMAGMLCFATQYFYDVVVVEEGSELTDADIEMLKSPDNLLYSEMTVVLIPLVESAE